ncbi:hypothetical protein ILUMI_08441 [Ignelater luminosus]|uniref:Uncharacterized protein n=1 Tax=Ignelater luminosus TaxID=2038154 RepID=A0A8K0GAM7_IGNLU|nr:hypothetical protein ILUMI_08441 [Ignelater luminosus]
MPRTTIYLIGAMKNQILGSKLPSQKDCLSVLFYNMRVVNMNLSDAANLVIDECLIFWKKARIPTKHRSDCVKKLKRLYETWRNLEKSCKRLSDTQKSKEKIFEGNMNNLFDIAHVNALSLISIEEDKEFLIAQRKPDREDSMIGIDLKLTAAEKRKAERKKKEETKKQRVEAEMMKYHALGNVYERTIISNCASFLVPVPGSFSTDSNISDVEKNISTEQYETHMSDIGIASSSNSDLSMNVSYNILQEPCSSVAMRGRTLIVNRRLAAAMDKCRVSDRDAVHLLSACVESLSLNPMDYVINRSSIRRARQQYREDTAINIQAEFEQLNVDFAVVHWDTKLLPSVTGIEKQDRWPVIVKMLLTEQLLGVPLIPSGSGKKISNAVFNTLEKWGLVDKVQAFVFDTSSNTGRFNGACTLLEMKLGRNILFLACRHPIFELVLQAASVKLYSSSAPDIPLFKNSKYLSQKLTLRIFQTATQVVN